MKSSIDHAKKILYLTLIIKAICEENELSKSTIIEDFTYLMNQEEIDKERSLQKNLTLQMEKMEFWDK